MRPHLDFGDIIYHKYDPDMQLNFTQQLEQTQYKAALAVTGAWMGTSRKKLLEELGLETLYNRRRWCRRLCHFFSITTSKSPDYLFNEIPERRSIDYNLRNLRCYEQNVGRTMGFSSSYFITQYEWNLLEKSVQDSPSLAVFKSKLLRIIRPEKNPVYNIYDILGIKLPTRLRVNFSPLNEHRFRRNFDSLSPICICSTGKEDMSITSCTAPSLQLSAKISLAKPRMSDMMLLA